MLGTFGAPDESYFSVPRLSPDDRRVVAYRIVQGNADVWLLDGTHMSRFTFDPALDRFPVWSPDGTRIAFDSNRKGHRDLYVKAASGAGSEELLFDSQEDKTAQNWSPDGRFLMYQNLDQKTGYDLWVLPMSGEHKPRPFVLTNFNARFAQFSPDGRWVAYSSDETGRYETYVRPFVPATDPTAGSSSEPSRVSGQWQVSTAGGIFPRWRSDGKELYYVAPDGRIMAVAVIATASAFDAAAPVPLFEPRMFGGGTNPDLGRQYDVSRDGRFLVNIALDAEAAPITILQNWKPAAN
jgi:Tol biopolymer transport system component